jgi:hypothetical protein
MSAFGGDADKTLPLECRVPSVARTGIKSAGRVTSGRPREQQSEVASLRPHGAVERSRILRPTARRNAETKNSQRAGLLATVDGRALLPGSADQPLLSAFLGNDALVDGRGSRYFS